jgi:hypothetical protein
MMQAAHHGKFDNRPVLKWFNGPGQGGVVIERPVGAMFVIVTKETSQNPAEMGFVEDDHVIQTFSTKRTNQSLDKRIQLGQALLRLTQRSRSQIPRLGRCYPSFQDLDLMPQGQVLEHKLLTVFEDFAHCPDDGEDDVKHSLYHPELGLHRRSK